MKVTKGSVPGQFWITPDDRTEQIMAIKADRARDRSGCFAGRIKIPEFDNVTPGDVQNIMVALSFAFGVASGRIGNPEAVAD